MIYDLPGIYNSKMPLWHCMVLCYRTVM